MKTKDAIAHFGTATALAKALKISVAAVSQWGDSVPVGRAYQIEVVSGGALKANDEREVTAA
jgi:DNA-binding transcriptional regulator YdaS (Cro superfamily)